jgi:hypothetical protein
MTIRTPIDTTPDKALFKNQRIRKNRQDHNNGKPKNLEWFRQDTDDWSKRKRPR